MFLGYRPWPQPQPQPKQLVFHTVPPDSTKANPGKIELTGRFSDQMALLCMSDDYSDVAFIVEDQRLPAHRSILAARSEYFRALLYGGLSESSQKEIQLKVPLEAFKAILLYIYSGRMSLFEMKEEDLLDTLGLVNQYGFTELESAISEYLNQELSSNNVCAILDAARFYNLEDLTKNCYTFMDRYASTILAHKSFNHLSKESLEELLRRDSFIAPEFHIYAAVSAWFKHNPNVEVDSFKSYVLRMRLDQLSESLRQSGYVWPEENVAALSFGSRTIQGECGATLLDGDITTYDMEKGCTRHGITEANDLGIVVELGITSIINHIKILLWDRDTRSYSYFVEVSQCQSQWDRVVDYKEYHCRSWQFLYFPPRAVKYIKIVGTHNTVDPTVFHVVALEAMYTKNMPKLVNGFVAPTDNVATVEMSAMVMEGVSRTQNALLNGDCRNYDWVSGYTYHQIGNGVILVRLGQPYYIGSLRLLLLDCNYTRRYGYYIETSTNQEDWEMVVDKRNESAGSWQHISFPARPVVFIKIVGTHSTANDLFFHCVHFECPSQDPTFKQAMKDAQEDTQDKFLKF